MKEETHIRKDNESDIPALAALLGHPEIFPMLGTPPFCTPQQLSAVLAGRGREDLGLCAYNGTNLLGFAQISRAHPSNRRYHAFTIMAAVHPEHQNKGIATSLVKELLSYADQWVPCERIEIVVDTLNISAIALYKKFGFEQEGLHRKYTLSEGKLRDVIAMARLKG